jgi:hypothetical protein
MYENQGDAELEALISACEAQWQGKRPIRTFPHGGVVRGLCPGCGLERVESVSALVDDGRLGGLTLDELADIMPCQRLSCRGRLDYRLAS